MNDSRSPRVLLVDDEEDFLESLGQRLSLRGLPVRTAADGPGALEIINSEGIDVVVLDVRMPGMDGIECLRRIKESHPQIEVVMLTGHADLESSLEGMRFGFFDYLTKPVRLEHLVEKIQHAFERGRGEQVAANETFKDKLQEHMILADRLASLGELAASIAHEINNPLAVISESAGWLRSRAEDDHLSEGDLRMTVLRALDKIERAVDRAARISRSFLNFSRAPDTIVREVDLGDLAAEVRELTMRSAAAANIEITVERGEAGKDTVKTDPFQLRQVLLNLVTNALHAVAQNGRVTITVEGGPTHSAIGVVDNGPGIAEEHLERIFEPFFTTKTDGRGTGLGLAVSRGIVEKLGGRLEVENRPGNGCTFRVVLPNSVNTEVK